jgi:hypothetical protein
MSNTLTAFFENLVAATSEYNEAVVGETAFLDGVYTAVQPEVPNRDTKTITIPFPDFGAFSDIGTGPLVDTALNPSSITLNMTGHPAASFEVKDLEQWQTGVEIREKFLDPMYFRAAEFLNGTVAAQLTTGNFNVNPLISGALAGEVAVADQLLAWDMLATQKVPLKNPKDLSLFVHNNTMRRMLGDTAWTQESLVGRGIAEKARLEGSLDQAFKFQIRWDQQAPKTITAITGTAALTGGATTIAGTGTNFTSAMAGQNLQITTDTTQALYRIGSYSSATSMAFAANYPGATASGLSVQAVSYLACAMHRYAIAVGMRPLPPPDTSVVHYQPIQYRGIPMRVMMSYQHRDLGWLMSVDFGYGIQVTRPAFGVLIQV